MFLLGSPTPLNGSLLSPSRRCCRLRAYRAQNSYHVLPRTGFVWKPRALVLVEHLREVDHLGGWDGSRLKVFLSTIRNIWPFCCVAGIQTRRSATAPILTPTATTPSLQGPNKRVAIMGVEQMLKGKLSSMRRNNTTNARALQVVARRVTDVAADTQVSKNPEKYS